MIKKNRIRVNVTTYQLLVTIIAEKSTYMYVERGVMMSTRKIKSLHNNLTSVIKTMIPYKLGVNVRFLSFFSFLAHFLANVKI